MPNATNITLTEWKGAQKEIEALTALCEAQRRKIRRLERVNKRLAKRLATAVAQEVSQ